MAPRRPARAVSRRARGRVFDAISRKRERPELSLSAAAREAGTSIPTIRSYAPSTIEREGTRGRWKVKPTDRLWRTMPVISSGQVHEVTARSSRQASRLGRYNGDVQWALRYDDDEVLRQYEGEVYAGYELETDLDTLKQMDLAGELDYEIASGER